MFDHVKRWLLKNGREHYEYVLGADFDTITAELLRKNQEALKALEDVSNHLRSQMDAHGTNNAEAIKALDTAKSLLEASEAESKTV